jgi:hypothetical protein
LQPKTASPLIVATQLAEVVTWVLFFPALVAQTTHDVAFHNAMMNYTTLKTGQPPRHWRLL